MKKIEQNPEKLRLRVSDAENRVFEVKSASGRSIGHAVGGDGTGPGLLIAGTGDEADQVFRRVVCQPGLASMRGRLVLLNLDRLDHPGDLAELGRLASRVRPITATLFLASVALEDAETGPARAEGLFEALAAFCAKQGVDLRLDQTASPVIRDYAS